MGIETFYKPIIDVILIANKIIEIAKLEKVISIRI